MTDYTALKAELQRYAPLVPLCADALAAIEELERDAKRWRSSAAPAPEPDKSIGILPCPCCGYRAELEQVPHAPEEPNAGGYYIECKRAGCGLTTRLAFSCKADAVPGLVKSWNRRPLYAAPQPDEAVALLRELVRRYDDYRGKGVMPAPGEYQMVVGAIERIRAFLKDRT